MADKPMGGFSPEEIKEQLESVAHEYKIGDWALEYIAQLEERVRELEADNKFIAQAAAKAAAKNVQIDGLLGYTCVLESMLRKREVRLPPRPSLMIDVYSSDEDTGTSEKALGVE